MSTTVEIDDVQSLVFSGHSRLPASLLVGLTVRDQRQARRAMTEFATKKLAVGFGDKSRTHATQLLLTASGVLALGGSESDLVGFSRQFRQGIVAPQRSRALGDAGKSEPGGWGWSDAELHALLIIYVSDDATGVAVTEEISAELGPGFSLTLRFPIHLPLDGREPFGFADGLSLTRIDVGDGRASEVGVALLPPGEVLLGYQNAAGVSPPSPPLGENGTFMVLRQLEQDVQAFWDFWRAQGRDAREAVWLASKALGRWPNGMPIDADAPTPEPPFDESVARAGFQFSADPRGRKCPFGAHVRRANPRDGLVDDPSASLAVVSQHRMIRRGRVYGPPAPNAWYPDVIRQGKTAADEARAGEPRGLLFACLCADIARQFEFVQQTWLNNPKFSDLYDEVDPIAAGHAIPADSHRFSIPSPPLRRRLSGVTRWVRVRGGGYFLVPGKRALLRFLAGAVT
jgi:deferrochelatase/peroxidase EfeB